MIIVSEWLCHLLDDNDAIKIEPFFQELGLWEVASNSNVT